MAPLPTDRLRPLERRILHLNEGGLDPAAIGERFRRSAGHIERILSWSRLPGRTGERARRGVLSPMERRVLDMRAEGLDHHAIGNRFRKGSDYIRRVEGIAHFKLAHDLLGS